MLFMENALLPCLSWTTTSSMPGFFASECVCRMMELPVVSPLRGGQRKWRVRRNHEYERDHEDLLKGTPQPHRLLIQKFSSDYQNLEKLRNLSGKLRYNKQIWYIQVMEYYSVRQGGKLAGFVTLSRKQINILWQEKAVSVKTKNSVSQHQEHKNVLGLPGVMRQGEDECQSVEYFTQEHYFYEATMDMCTCETRTPRMTSGVNCVDKDVGDLLIY